jgi:hypothetical protein
MATLNGAWINGMILDDPEFITNHDWSHLINKEFWNILYTEESEWDE